jgi:hypothetical protein
MKPKTVVMSKIEKRLMANVKLLDEKWVDIVKQNSDKIGQYIAFHNGCVNVAQTFGEALALGDAKYGKTAGFVVRKISDVAPRMGKITSQLEKDAKMRASSKGTGQLSDKQ